MTAGEAYVFFDSQAPLEEIQRNLPFAKDFAKGPSALELLLHQDLERLPVAIKQAHLAQNVSLPYILEGRLATHFKFPEQPGRSAAYELEAIFIILYQGTEPENAPCRAEIWYLEGNAPQRVSVE
ncbi:MAG TPA: hypothetical protein VLJ21_01525 [Candidatus Binatia bacterium]|nr:hypothetical protein [Candidatus Binatia bacterium]